MNNFVCFHEIAIASTQMLYFWNMKCTFGMSGYQRVTAAYSSKGKTVLFMTSGSDSMGAKTNQPRLE